MQLLVFFIKPFILRNYHSQDALQKYAHVEINNDEN